DPALFGSLASFGIVELPACATRNGGITPEESADFVEFLGLAGLGNAEAAALTWGDIDWQRNTITTFRHKTNAGFSIPIYPQVRALLERRFAGSTGDPGKKVFTVRKASKAIASACVRLKLPAYSHRHSRNRAWR